MKTKHQTSSRDRGMEGGGESVRPGATRTPNGSITEGMMSYFLLRWAENKKLDWPNISVRGKYKIIGTLFNMKLFFRNKKIVMSCIIF